MSQLRSFSLIGDSNVKNNVNKTSCRANASVKAAQILTCGHLGIFPETLAKVREESNVCILSCFTNFLTGADGVDSISQRINPVLHDVREALVEACGSFPERQYLLSPPMYRASPVWYREGLPEVLTSFSQVFSQDKPPNLHLLSSFPTPAFLKDGVHLTSFSGLEFLLHLFDGSQDLLDGLEAAPDALASKRSENTRVLEDRVMALEQDHRRLNRIVESKVAIDAEYSDFRDNFSNQDSLVLAGLPLIPSEIVGKEWQDLATKHVSDFMKLLMGKVLPMVFIRNSTARHQDAVVTYTVKMRDVADSKAIRDKFGAYFIGMKDGKDGRPENLKRYSVRNFVTPETKVRIAVLQVLARRYRNSNPGSKVQVVGYDPRPRMKITPAANASDRRVLVYNFIQAVKALPTNFSQEELEFIYKKVNPKWSGTLRSTFICLSDDDYKKSRKRPVSNDAGAENGENGDFEFSDVDESASDATAPAPVVTSASGRGSGRGSSVSRGRGRGDKRGADSPADSAAPAKK